MLSFIADSGCFVQCLLGHSHAYVIHLRRHSLSSWTLTRTVTCLLCSSSDGSSSKDSETDDDEGDTVLLQEERILPKAEKRPLMKGKERKQIVMVDKRGKPYGKEAAYLANDVKAFAKGLNPAYGWANQPMAEKQRFFDRIYAGEVL